MDNNLPSKTFGEQLRQRRKEKGWSQDELAERSGISKAYISTLERSQPHTITGALPRPYPDKIEKLANALDWNKIEARNLALGLSSSNETNEVELNDFQMLGEIFYKYSQLSQEKRVVIRILLQAVKRELDKTS